MNTMNTSGHRLFQTVGLALALTGLTHFAAPGKQFALGKGGAADAPGHSEAMTTIRGIAAPHQMVSLREHTSMVVPAGRIFTATGVITTENWSGPSPVVVRFDGQVVYKSPMYPGDVVTFPPGLTAGPGTNVEVDRLSAAADSRVTLLGYTTRLD